MKKEIEKKITKDELINYFKELITQLEKGYVNFNGIEIPIPNEIKFEIEWEQEDKKGNVEKKIEWEIEWVEKSGVKEKVEEKSHTDSTNITESVPPTISEGKE